jgi:hypothetical protein
MRLLIQAGAMLVGWLLLVALFKWAIPYDDTDDVAQGNRSGMHLYIDHGTGCQYVSGFLSGMTPRMGADGKQVCRKDAK